jgi:hypothetical protein
MNKREISLAVVDRFFQAFEILLQNGQIRSVMEFCLDNDIDRANFHRLDRDRWRTLHLHLIYYITTRHKVDANWLFTGAGNMFRQ